MRSSPACIELHIPFEEVHISPRSTAIHRNRFPYALRMQIKVARTTRELIYKYNSRYNSRRRAANVRALRYRRSFMNARSLTNRLYRLYKRREQLKACVRYTRLMF